MKPVFAILSLVVLATASPLEARTPPKSVVDASNKCGNNNVLSCCNDSSKETHYGELLGLSKALSPGQCGGYSLSAISVLQGLMSTSSICSGNTVKCCAGNKQTGYVNVNLQCTGL